MQQERPALTQPSVHFQRLAGFTALCLVLAAFNLRPALTSLSTMLTEIQDGLQISSFWAGILTTIPVLCFGIFGPLAPVLSSRIGVERAIFLLFLVLATGIGLRQFDFKILLVLSTLAAGASIGMAGVLLPVVIRRDFPHQIGLMTGLYTMVLSIGGATGAGLTPMIERHFGAWNSALAVWSVPAVLAAALWGLTALAQPKAGRAARMPPFSALLRDPIAWAVTGYMGLQAALAFIVLGWLPTLLRDRGLDVIDAGFVTSVSIIAQTITALLTPILATRSGSPRALVMTAHLGFRSGTGAGRHLCLSASLHLAAFTLGRDSSHALGHVPEHRLSRRLARPSHDQPLEGFLRWTQWVGRAFHSNFMLRNLVRLSCGTIKQDPRAIQARLNHLRRTNGTGAEIVANRSRRLLPTSGGRVFVIEYCTIDRGREGQAK
jgi:MFS transporter, CP family, cyanate transporter